MSKSIFRDLLKREEYLNYFHAIQLIEKCREKKIKIFWWDIVDVQSDGLHVESYIHFTTYYIEENCNESVLAINQLDNKYRLLYIPVIDFWEDDWKSKINENPISKIANQDA